MIKNLIAIFLLVFSAAACVADTPTGIVASGNHSVMIGDRFPYELSVVVPASAEVIFPTASSTFAPFEIKSFKSAPAKDTYQSNGAPAKKIIGSYILSAYDIGTFFVPTVTVVVKEQGTAGSVVFPPVKVEVLPVPKGPKDKDDLRDVSKPFTIPYNWVDVLLVIVLIIAMVGLCWYLWKKYKNKQAVVHGAPAAILLTPYELARQKLSAIEGSELRSPENFKDYYTAVSDVLRDYLFQQFQIDAMEMTTSELLRAMKRFRYSWEEQQAIREWLSDSDLVKFAKYVPDATHAASHLAQAGVLLDRFFSAYVAITEAAEKLAREKEVKKP